MRFASSGVKGEVMNLLENRKLLKKKARAWEVLNTANGGVVTGRERVIQAEKGYRIKVTVPTVPEDHFRVTLDYQELIISVLRHPVTHPSVNAFIYHKTFRLPNIVDVDNIEAVYDHGQLMVFLPYLEVRKNLRRDIDIKH